MTGVLDSVLVHTLLNEQVSGYFAVILGESYTVLGDTIHLVVELDLFVNNAKSIATAKVSVNPKDNPSKMAIGQERDAIQHPGKESFDGEIARFLLWDRPLTDAELKAVFEGVK